MINVYTMQRVAEILAVQPSRINYAIKQGALPQPGRANGLGMRIYTDPELEIARQFFATHQRIEKKQTSTITK